MVISQDNDCELDDDLTDDYTGKKVYVSIPKIMKRAAKAMVAQPDRWPRVFIRELKRMNDGMPLLISELTSHSEAFDEFAGHIRTNENKSAKKLVKSMNQHYLDYLSEMGMMESVVPPMDTRMQPPSAPAMGSMGGGSMGGGGDMGGDMGGMGGSAGGLPGGEFGGGGSATAGGPASPGPGEQPGSMNFPGTESKKEFGYHHLIKEMGGYDNMKNAMTEYLGS